MRPTKCRPARHLDYRMCIRHQTTRHWRVDAQEADWMRWTGQHFLLGTVPLGILCYEPHYAQGAGYQLVNADQQTG